jgi:hypothetical protein
MKKLTSPLLILVSIALLHLGCGGDPQKKGPQETAQAFLEALQYGDYDQAKEYCTESSRKNLAMFETFSGIGANPFAGEFEITREEISKDGSYAKVFYNQGDEGEKYVRLRNVDKHWEVMANKADFSRDKDDDEDDDNGLNLTGATSGADHARINRKLREGKSAREIADAFLSAIMFGDFDMAKNLASKASETALNMQSMNDEQNLEGYDIVRVNESGNYATVYYIEKGETEEKELKLGKDPEDNWQVLISKDDTGGNDLDLNLDMNDEDDETEHANDNRSLREGKSAEEIADAFLKAMSFGDFAKAKKLASHSSESAINMQKNSRKSSLDGYSILKTEIEGDYATVTYQEEGEDLKKELKLGKDPNGNWQVIMSKND